MILVPLAFGVAASAATLVGGLLALRLEARITIVLGLAAGIVLGVALFDLIPEAIALAEGIYAPRTILAYVALGLGAYLLLDRVLDGIGHAARPWRAHLGPASLTLHSLLDGMGIGLAFQISPAIGWIVALAVLTHDVADGINTVSLVLASSARGTAWKWLIANGAAPTLGVVAGLTIRVPGVLLAPLLAVFAGVFLYIGACELLPRSHARDPRLRVTAASLAGIALMLLVTAAAR
ncbi:MULTISPECIES: ZIP family metal transporter [unclassified Sphingomonas]|uniref:ZIP family metal transporter n=1 Tax=unclassified Sphingomonas TaxID=196159 RepID=UPI001F579330|nr:MULTISPECIES: ZIP family metal transporter [unclassified Sphingomonas]